MRHSAGLVNPRRLARRAKAHRAIRSFRMMAIQAVTSGVLILRQNHFPPRQREGHGNLFVPLQAEGAGAPSGGSILGCRASGVVSLIPAAAVPSDIRLQLPWSWLAGISFA